MGLTEKLNELLQKKKWTYYKLSKISGVGMNTTRELVYGERKTTSHENLLRFASAFDINVSELLEGGFTEVKEKQLGDDYIDTMKLAKEKGIPADKLRDLIELIDNIKSDK